MIKTEEKSVSCVFMLQMLLPMWHLTRFWNGLKAPKWCQLFMCTFASLLLWGKRNILEIFVHSDTFQLTHTLPLFLFIPILALHIWHVNANLWMHITIANKKLHGNYCKTLTLSHSLDLKQLHCINTKCWKLTIQSDTHVIHFMIHQDLLAHLYLPHSWNTATWQIKFHRPCLQL